MPRNGSGSYSRVASTPYVYNTVIDQVVVNAEMDDIATALTNSLAKNGETTPTANLPMGTYRHTNVGNASARTDYAAAGQVQDGKLNWVDGGGTADAITANYSPAITALVDGQLCCVRATAANATTTPTFAPNGLTARTIVQMGGLELVAGSIRGDGHELILRYDLTNTRWELLNPAAGSASQSFSASTLTTKGRLNVQSSDAAAQATVAAKYTASVSTTPATISAIARNYGQMVIVWGNSSGNIFTDLIFTSATAGPTVLSVKTVSGTPDARTYTMSESNLQLAMASGTYDVSCSQFMS